MGVHGAALALHNVVAFEVALPVFVVPPLHVVDDLGDILGSGAAAVGFALDTVVGCDQGGAEGGEGPGEDLLCVHLEVLAS